MGQEIAQKYCYVKESQVIQIHCFRNHTLAKCIYKMLIKILCVNTTHMHTDKHIHRDILYVTCTQVETLFIALL